jgi:hypothetical protein
MDNLNIHRRKSLTDVFGVEIGSEIWDRFTVHYTPTHGSWLNQAEIEIGLFSRQCLGSRRIPNLKALRRESRAWTRQMNRSRTKSTGSSTAKRPVASSTIKEKSSRGQRPSSKSSRRSRCRL